MQFRGDERGQAIQIGAVLLLGALVISFSLYQALVVPDQNREIEFNHNQEVQSQLQDLRNGVVSTGSGGDGRSVSVRLGTRYPSRVIALNPGPPSGTLRTVGTTDEAVNATVANAAAEGEIGDYWTGANKTFNTGSLQYRPGYNEYANAPVTWYEHSVLFNGFRDSNLTLTDQRLVDGTDISLVTVNGSYYADRSGSVSLDVRSVSASSTTVPVTNATPTSNVTVTLPTHLSERDWKTLLRQERETGRVTDVSTRPVANASYQMLRVELERGPTYDLQLARVGVGTNVRDTETAYLTDVAGNGSSVPEGGTTQLTVEVRDRLDNPVGGVGVTAETQRSDSSVSPTGTDSDSDGEVTLTYEAPADIDGESQKTDLVNASIDVPASAVDDPDFDPETPLNVTMVVKVDNSDGSGLGGGGGDGAYNINWQPDTNQSGFSLDNGSYVVNASKTNSVDLLSVTDPTAQDATVDFSLSNATVGQYNPSGTDTRTNSDGKATAAFEPTANGSVAAFVASGGSGDRLDLVVEGVSSGGNNTAPTADFTFSPSDPETGQSVSFDASASNDPDGSINSYSWDFGDGTNDTGETTTHTYSSSGDYTVTLTVTDGDGATDSATGTVTVDGAMPSASSITAETNEVGNGNNKIDEVTFDYDVSDGNELDSITFFVNETGGGNLESRTVSLSGTSSSGTETLTFSEISVEGNGNSVDVKTITRDTAGNELVCTETMTETNQQKTLCP